MKAKILIVEDDSSLRSLLVESMSIEGHASESVDSAEAALARLKQERFDILITDVNLPGKTGIELLPLALQTQADLYMLVMTGFASVDSAVQAMKHGARDFLTKPISLSDLLSAIRIAVSKLPTDRSKQTTSDLSGSPAASSIIAKSPLMIGLLKEVEMVAPYKINVLITGETGTGKELVAREIHARSPRAKNEMVALNCAAIPEQLLEDELFGHVKGAFTGAQNDRKGRFEQADGGTLFLDEIGDMNLALQAKLLRVLQESEFEKLGSSKTMKVDVRVVAATSANIEQKIADGSFRPDLYHRLNVVHLKIPPLRERPGDILPIARGVLDRFCQSVGLPAKTIADEVSPLLVSYSFPGNVRQLQNLMERAAIFSSVNSTIKLEHLPEEIKNQPSLFQMPVNAFVAPEIPDEGLDFSSVVSQVERDLLLQTLDKTGGNKMRAAKLLNMKRTTLVEKLKRLQIETDTETEEEISAAG